MSAQKGSNGIQDGLKNEQLFLAWMNGVEDFRPFIRQGLLNISKIAREAGLLRGVWETNTAIRDKHWPELLERLEREGVLKPRVAQPAELVPRTRSRSASFEARIKQIQEENAAVKAENAELRKQLDKCSAMDEILTTTGRLPW